MKNTAQVVFYLKVYGNLQTVASATVMVLQDKTWSHPKNNLPNRSFGNPECGSTRLSSQNASFSALLAPKSIYVIRKLQVVRSRNSKTGGKNYFYADIFGLYDHKYVQSSDYKTRIGGKFIWTDGSGAYTPEAYEMQKHVFAGIFKPTDIRYFLVFENNAGISTLDYMMKLFNGWFKMNRNTIGVTLSSFDRIADLRI